MKITITAVLASLLVASTCVEANDFKSSSSGMVRRHHSKQAQQLQKRAFSGKATWYGVNPGDLGACGGKLNAGDFFVALNEGQYGSLNAQSSYCGKTITITNGIKTTQAKILDACPKGEQCHYGALDMSRALFEYFNPFSVGVFDITWWVGGDDNGGGAKASSSSDDNSDNSDSSSNNDTADAKATANRAAAKKKEAAKEAAAEKKKKEAAAKKAAAKKKKEEAAKKKKLAEKKKKEAAKKAEAEKVRTAQKQNIAAFGEIMQALNQMVESAAT